MTTQVTHDQILYKLGALETGITNILEHINQLRDEIKSHKVDTNAEILVLKDRVMKLETFKTRALTIGTLLVGVWAALGDHIIQGISRLVGGS